MNDLGPSVNLLDALWSRGIPFHRSATDTNEITINCPFCTDNRFRLGINILKDLGHCFNCNYSSRQVLKEISDALELGLLSGTIAEADEPKKREAPGLPEDFVLLSNPPDESLYKRARTYLLERGVKGFQIREKKLGASLIGRYAYRIIFPVYYGLKLQGLVTRDFTGQQEQKYLNSPGMKVVYNLPGKKKKKAVLCEGVFDCLALERVLPRDSVDVLALLGHALTSNQEELLADYEDIFLWPDADSPGLNGFIGIGKQLLLHHRVFIVPPTGAAKDAGDMQAGDLAYMWTTRTRLTENVEMRLRAEVSFRE